MAAITPTVYLIAGEHAIGLHLVVLVLDVGAADAVAARALDALTAVFAPLEGNRHVLVANRAAARGGRLAGAGVVARAGSQQDGERSDNEEKKPRAVGAAVMVHCAG